MIRTKLRRNQREALRRASRHRGFALFSQQRVGKSLTALAIADVRKPDILFIVCPKGALKVWRKQIKEHLEIDWDCQVILVHYEAVCRNAKDRRWYRHRFRHEWADKSLFLIVDEVHRTKRRGSMQSRMLRSLGALSNWVLGLSGTPTDKLEDYWAIFNLIQPGVLEDEFEDFVDRYCKVAKIKVRSQNRRYTKIVGYKRQDELSAIIHKYSYRITLREAQIEAGRKPYRIKRTMVRFDLLPESRRIYNELEKELEAEVRKRKISRPLVITLVSALQQIAGGYIIHKERLFNDDGTPQLTDEGKPKVLKEIVPVGREKLLQLSRLITMDSVFSKEKFVICAAYTHEIEAIGRRLDRLGRTWKAVQGGESFDGSFDTDCVLLQVRSGEAIDLSAASTYVFFSWNWSFINYEQSKFRILKFNTRLVRYYYLIANDTVDEEIYEAVTTKQNIARLVQDVYRHKNKKVA